jgi:hypothetical protein
MILKRKEFKLPEPGLRDAEIIEVADRGIVQTKFGLNRNIQDAAKQIANTRKDTK